MLPTAPLEELPRPELEPDVLLGLLGLVELLELGLDTLPPALELDPARARASQSCFAMPVIGAQSLRLPEPLVLEPRLPEPEVLDELLGEVVLGELLLPALLPVLGVVLLPVLGVLGVVLLGLDGLVLGLVADPPIEPLELEVCATETPAAPRNAAATAAQRSLLVIVLLL